MKNTGIGVIGCGKQGRKHLSGLRRDDTRIVVCDVDVARARSLAETEGVAFVESSDQLLGDPEIVAVDIATPTPSHGLLIEQAIQAGKHFFCEKPLCETAGQARRIAELAEAKGVVGVVGYVYRFAPVFEAGHALSRPDDDSAILGKAVSALFRIGGRGEHAEWKHCQATGGGATKEMLVHMLDLAIWYFGALCKLEVVAHKLLRPMRRIAGLEVEVDAEDFVVVQLAMERCPQVLIQADLVTPAFSQYAEVQYERGGFMGSIQPDAPSYVFATQDSAPYGAGKNMLHFGTTNLFDRQMSGFLDSVVHGARPRCHTISDSIPVMEALGALEQAIGRQ